MRDRRSEGSDHPEGKASEIKARSARTSTRKIFIWPPVCSAADALLLLLLLLLLLVLVLADLELLWEASEVAGGNKRRRRDSNSGMAALMANEAAPEEMWAIANIYQAYRSRL